MSNKKGMVADFPAEYVRDIGHQFLVAGYNAHLDLLAAKMKQFPLYLSGTRERAFFFDADVRAMLRVLRDDEGDVDHLCAVWHRSFLLQETCEKHLSPMEKITKDSKAFLPRFKGLLAAKDRVDSGKPMIQIVPGSRGEEEDDDDII